MLAPDGTFKPLGFYSAHLTETQKKYSVFKKELLGAFKSLRHFLPDIYGKHVTLYTDHLPLQMAFQSPSDKIPLNDPQVYRQLTEIGRFTRDVKHISGIDNIFADYLSRIKEETKGTAYLEDEAAPEVASAETVQFQLLSLPLLRDLQASCEEIKRIQSGDKPKSAEFGEVEIDGVNLFCETSSKLGNRPYVPQELRHQIMESLHFDHLGIDATTKRIATHYYWPTMKADIKLFVKICNTCKKIKPGKKNVNTGTFDVPDKRFSHVMVDVVGPLPVSNGYRFLLTAICRSTRNLQAIPLKEASSAEVADAFLHHWAAIWGLPSKMTSDNGGSFSARLWQDMMKKLNIEVKYSASYRPESIGMLERQHQCLKNSLKAALIDMGEVHQERWYDFLPFVLLGRRVAYQPDLKASASELTFGKNVTIPGQLLSDPEDVEDHSAEELLSLVRKKTDVEARQPSRHNPPERQFPPVPDNVTHVYTRQHQTTGLQAPYEGPFRVEEKVSRSVWKIEVGSYKDGRKRFEYRHLNDLKFAHPQSLAAPVERAKLGRPTSDLSKVSVATDKTNSKSKMAPVTPLDRFDYIPNPTVTSRAENVNNENGANNLLQNHATSSSNNNNPPSEDRARENSNARPVRTTRNARPNYVSAIWQASPIELAIINQSIGHSNLNAVIGS